MTHSKLALEASNVRDSKHNSKQIEQLIEQTQGLALTNVNESQGKKKRVPNNASKTILPKGSKSVPGKFPIQRIKPVENTKEKNNEPNFGIECQIEKILDKRIKQDELEYLVKWKHYLNKHNEWLKDSQITDRTLVERFKKQRKKLKFCHFNMSKTYVLPSIPHIHWFVMSDKN